MQMFSNRNFTHSFNVFERVHVQSKNHLKYVDAGYFVYIYEKMVC